MKAKLAFVFPGQGSQQPGMLAELAERYSVVRSTFDEASAALGFNLWDMVQNASADVLSDTAITQPALLTASVAIWRVWQELEGVRPDIMAGHSLGEYSALVCAGSIGFADGVRLVRLRGQAMQSAVKPGEGAMAAILGLDAATVEKICEEAAQDQVVTAVNYNGPGQIVIAGHLAAVERSIALCQKQGAKRAMRLPVSVPAHCILMQDAAHELAEALQKLTIKTPRYQIVQNVDAQFYQKPEEIVENLISQLYRPVLWTQCVEALVKEGVGIVIECGPGKVLTSINKRINRHIIGFAVNDPDSLHTALQQMRSETLLSE